MGSDRVQLCLVWSRLPCFHLVFGENLLKWLLWICSYLIIMCLISSIREK